MRGAKDLIKRYWKLWSLKPMSNDINQGPYCKVCETPKNSGYCEKCQKDTPNLFMRNFAVTAKVRISGQIAQKRPWFKGFVKKIYYGYRASGDIKKFPEGVNIELTIDREKREKHHIVIDNLTGKITHEEHEPLDQHRSKSQKN